MTGFAPDLYGRGLSFPPRIGPGGALVFSTGELNVRECLCTILRTTPGERVERPGFGCALEGLLYEPATVATLRLIQDEVTQAISRWEPRVRLDAVTAGVNPDDPRAVDVSISYTLVASAAAERLRLTVTAGR